MASVMTQKHNDKKFIFKPLNNSDLNLLCGWFEKPHVLEWWSDRFTPEEIKEKYRKRIGDSIVCPMHIAFIAENRKAVEKITARQVLFAAAGYNFRLILKWLRDLFFIYFCLDFYRF